MFECKHKKTSRVFTAPGGRKYIVCTDCGAEFAYDWSAMRAEMRAQSGARAGRFMASGFVLMGAALVWLVTRI